MSGALLRAARAGLRCTQIGVRTKSALYKRRTTSAGRRISPKVFARCLFWSSNDDSESNDGAKSDAKTSDDGAINVELVSTQESTALTGSDKVPPLGQVLALPTIGRPLFPGLACHIVVRHSDTIEQLKQVVKSGQPYVGVFLDKQVPSEEYISVLPSTISYVDDPVDVNSLYSVGTFAQIMQVSEQFSTEEPGAMVALSGHRRIRMNPESAQMPDPPGAPLVNVDHLYVNPYDHRSEKIIMYTSEILSTLREISSLNPLFREQVQYLAQHMNLFDPARIADLATMLTTSSSEALQDILCTLNAEERLQKMFTIVKQEHQRAVLQQEMSSQVEQKMKKDQREYFLREQLKSIKKELGIEKDDKDAVLQRFTDRLKDVILSKEVQEAIDDELEKFKSLEKNSAEYNVTRNYLDWLTTVPWGKYTTDVFDVKSAAAILDEDHYGMSEVKDRILEFVAVGKLRGEVQGKILCLVGPPGVGKTSIASSVGRCIDRKFNRFSVGGVSDVSEIKGHRRTYVGSMPGKLIQCLKASGTSNPVILIDEIDKLGRGGIHGDPSSALLEVLDPNQNDTFVDHYLDVPVDLSKVLFVCTANTTDTIPGPLLDRMEVVRLSGYDLPEKIAIAQKYLIPKIQAATGLGPKQENNEVAAASSTTVNLTDEALHQLIKGYCREAGVRVLERKLETIYRKAALKIVKESVEDSTSSMKELTVSTDDLHHYVGQPLFQTQRMYDQTPVGVVMGLAWNTMGGSTLYIEAASVGHGPNKKPGLRITGNMKEVMKESTQIALTCAKIKLSEWASNIDFLDTHELHLHVPEGATPKDGPSAGCTMVTALLSLALNRPVRDDLAMTGEISLTGRILPVGGIREKVIAARREGVKCLVLPKGNQSEYGDLPDYLREGLEVHFAEHYDDVFDIAFCEDIYDEYSL